MNVSIIYLKTKLLETQRIKTPNGEKAVHLRAFKRNLQKKWKRNNNFKHFRMKN